MDFQYKGEASEEIDLENEYEIQIKIESLKLTQHQPGDIKLLFIFGDFVHKMEFGDGMKDLILNFTLHSVPAELSQKLSNIPILLHVVSKDNLKPLGSSVVEVNECFANAINCGDFRSESIRKNYELMEGRVVHGTVTIIFGIVKDIGNSNRHRRFYTEATQQKQQLDNKDL